MVRNGTVAAAACAPVPDEQLAALLAYVVRVGGNPPDLLLSFVRSHAGNRLETIMKTTAEQLIEQGEARGEVKGEARGKANARQRPTSQRAARSCGAQSHIAPW